MTTQPSKQLETFENPVQTRDYRIHMEIPEFTCLCPKTGQPDFARLTLDYIPDKNVSNSRVSSSTSGHTVMKALSTKQ